MVFQAIESKFALLDDIPDSLYTELVTHAHGNLLPRVKAILHWRACMLSGRLPEECELDWPEASIKRTLLMRLETLDIVQYCVNQETLTDSILKDILDGVSSAEDYFALKPGGFVDKLAQRQNIRRKSSSFKDEEGLADHVQHPRERDSGRPEASSEPQPRPGEQNTQDRDETHAVDVQAAAEQMSGAGGTSAPSPDPDISPGTEAGRSGPVAEAGHDVEMGTVDEEIDAVVAEKLQKNWQELAASWHELASMYSELGGLLGCGWDLSQGVLAAEGWRDIIRYRKLLKQLPELRQLIATLGRLRQVAGEETLQSVSEQVFTPIQRQVTVEQESWSHRAAMETGGIVLSDELSRLLPSELALLGHPRLKMLWYAKRAERKLLTYCHCGQMPDPLLIDQAVDIDGPMQQNHSSRAYGPIIICLDTSGSMHGKPEAIAKALVLEGLRIAYHENRACFVYLFSGPEQVLEHELDLTRGGLLQLLGFLQQSFHGGTDVVQPLLRALERQNTEQWRDADILLVSDGRFPLQMDVFSRVEKLKNQQGLRLHGLLLGRWKSRAIERLCDPLHVYADWAEYGLQKQD